MVYHIILFFKSINKLKTEKNDGYEGLTSDYFHQGTPLLYECISILFTCMIKYSFAPGKFGISNIVTIPWFTQKIIRRSVCARVERTKQVERETHSLFGHTPARRRLKSRRSFLTSVQPVHFPAKVV